ncbi:ABC transporter substrate-binding protein [Micrococcoides hystricis]|uniref:ABC transporter substrate-binding protein n=1 Tax=Micrococcoides hystricis TaxID=1572761 RepID=A0ABV6PCL2_9MICC
MKKGLLKSMAVGAIALLGLTACGSGGGNDAAESETTKITVGVLSIAPSVAMEYGIQEGIFEKHGLEVELQTGQGGAAMLPAVSTGQMQFAVGNPLSVLTAADKGMDMRIVTGYSNSKADGDDINGVVVRKDSNIKEWADLEGNTTAVNALKTQGDLTILASTEKAGGDPSKLNFSEMPFPDMPAQLERGNMDAMWAPEPVLSMALADEDNELLGYPNQEAIPGMPTMVSFTSGNYAEENPEVIEKFQAAMKETLSAAQENDQDARALLPDFVNMDKDLAENMNMEDWDGEIPTDQLQELADFAVKFEFLGKDPDMDKVLLK